MTLTKEYLHNCSKEHLYIMRDNRLFNIECEMDDEHIDLNSINSLEFELRQIIDEIKKRQ
tara:strand:- start:23 stop:202 length:180 start_codon:yes stop_codon:yes gene_type:complete